MLLKVACLSLSIITATFPGEPRLASFIGAKDDGSVQLELQDVQSSSKIVTTKQQTNIFFTSRMPFLSPDEQCQNTEGKNITFHRLIHPKLTWRSPHCLWPLKAPGYLGGGMVWYTRV